MHPEICKIGPFTIYSYGLMLAVAFAVSSALLITQAKKQDMNPDTVFSLAFIVFISGVIGARAFYVIDNIAYYKRNMPEIIMLQRGGLSWFGGLIAGIFASIFYLKTRKLSIYKVMDLVAPFVVLGQAIGRVGCLLNGCCFGKESGFGIYFPVHKAILIPVQISCSLILIIIFIILRYLQERPHRDGQIFYMYLLLYSAKRFFIEFWRADNEIILFGLTLFQLMSILFFVLALTQLAKSKPKPNA
jgi:phosphatidylglycerol:prolipoprotein diacylglycerol transferase